MKITSRQLWLLLCVGMSLFAWTTKAQESTPPFKDVTDVSGINSPRQEGGEKVTGQAWGDYDQDGWPDLYLTDTDGVNTLYHNNGDGTFSVSGLTHQVALPDSLSGGAVFADYNNDGWPDLYVMNWGANKLYRNIAGNGFFDITEKAGVGDESNGKTASWGDYDQDGLLDLYLANWSCTPKCGRSFEGDKDRLYHNDGDNTFTDVTIALGSKTRGAGFVASFVDFDNDADLDIYLVNDEFINPIGNVLWRNDGAGCDAWCFTDVAEEFGADTRVMGMGLATGDYDNDGDFDFYFSNAGPMTLLQNQGDGFENMAVDAGVEFSKSVGWGSVFFDYNNDGWSDLYLAVMDGVSGGTTINALFENNGDGTFTDLAEASGAGNSGHSIGVAYADYDMDGWVDLVVGNYDEGYTLYRNQGARLSSNNWLTFKLVGSGAVNRDAAGARVTVVDSNGRSQMQEVRIGSSLGSGDSLELHFGFGDAIPESVIIRWPDGSEQMIDAPELNQRIVVTYGVTVVAEPVETDATGFVVLLTAVLFSVIALMIVKEKKWK